MRVFSWEYYHGENEPLQFFGSCCHDVVFFFTDTYTLTSIGIWSIHSSSQLCHAIRFIIVWLDSAMLLYLPLPISSILPSQLFLGLPVLLLLDLPESITFLIRFPCYMPEAIVCFINLIILLLLLLLKVPSSSFCYNNGWHVTSRKSRISKNVKTCLTTQNRNVLNTVWW